MEASMKLLGDVLSYLWGNLTQTLTLKGTWLPKLVPFTDQANINMAGNGTVFFGLQSLETLFHWERYTHSDEQLPESQSSLTAAQWLPAWGHLY